MTMKYAPQCEGRYMLVGTLYSLLLVDLVSKEQVILDRNYNGYYGFEATDTHIYVGVRHNIPERRIKGKDSNGEILVYDYNFNLTKILKPDFPLHEIHEILWHEGKLYVTNTGYDMITIYDGISWEKWYPLEKLLCEKTDIHHFNSLTIHNGKLYICAHSYGPSTVYVFSLSNREKIDEISIGNCAHNIWFDNNDIHVCNSNDCTIISNNNFIKHFAEWPRGIALCKDLTIVGSSALAGYGAPYGEYNAHIYIYDKLWQKKGFMLLRGESQVNDIIPIEQYLDPARFFEDPRFTKESLIGFSTTSNTTQNEETLLTLYSTSCKYSGRLNQKIKTIKQQQQRLQQQLQQIQQIQRLQQQQRQPLQQQVLQARLEKLERRTLSGRLKKLTNSIKKRLRAMGIGNKED